MYGQRYLAPLAFLAVIGGHALADGHAHKLSPLARQAALTASATHAVRGSKSPGSLTAFVMLRSADDSILTAHGCRLFDRKGDIAIASIPRTQLLALAASPLIARIEAGAPCRLTLDTTRLLIGAKAAHEAQSLPQAYTGRGVVVGVMDVGFDLTHPTFLTSDGSTSRIGALWDQLCSDTIGSQLAVGRDYVGADATQALGHSADGYIETHGTHTAALAAGNGYDSPYRGIAPESELCLVANAVTSNISIVDSADWYRYTTATDALGFKYLFDYAEAAGKPCVASFSEGYHATYDAEDSLFCAYLNRLTGPGRIIVAAAGNESRVLGCTYIAKPQGMAEAGAFVSTLKSTNILLRGTGNYGFKLLGYMGATRDSVAIGASDLPLDSLVERALLTSEGDTACRITAKRYIPALADRTPLCLVHLASDATIYNKGVAFALTGAGEAEAFSLYGASLFYAEPAVDTRWTQAESNHNVLAPACFEGVVAVGATTHRTAVTNYLGVTSQSEQDVADAGRLSHYSSRGPAINGAIKPDVAAPGTNVISAYSSFYEEANPNATDINSDVAHFSYNGRTYAWNSNAGTSMACPVAAGVVALWLEAEPTLTPSDVIELLRRTSRQPEASLDYPNNLYGYGEIDAYRGLIELLGLSAIEEVSSHQPARASITVSGQMLHIRFAEAPLTEELSVTLYSLDGRRLFSETLNPQGQTQVSLALPPLASGVYAVQLKGREEGLTGSQLVRID